VGGEKRGQGSSCSRLAGSEVEITGEDLIKNGKTLHLSLNHKAPQLYSHRVCLGENAGRETGSTGRGKACFCRSAGNSHQKPQLMVPKMEV
jgi:hypothetical protein